MSIYAKYQDIDDYEEEQEEKEFNIITILGFIATWFIRIGVVLGVILLLYFIFTGQVVNALLFILGLIIAYFFGYFFMFLLDKFVELGD